ncbi:hypothetical protein [Streptomyces sp. NPDC051665]|uniref:hypothetical protein n=1 Tax=Streptomyces sp. NPDC051665 TaxID=3154647 RepID=UPI00343EEBA6
MTDRPTLHRGRGGRRRGWHHGLAARLGRRRERPPEEQPLRRPTRGAHPTQNPASASGTGRPRTLWELENVADVYSPRLPPVRDVLVFGAASGGMAVYGVKDSCLSLSTG